MTITTSPSNPPSSSSSQWAPTAGGVLSIVSGSLAILGSIILFFFTLAAAAFSSGFFNDPGAPPVAILFVLSLFLLALGILAVIGGISALKRMNYGLALAGAIAAIFTGGTVLGILAIVFIAMSQKEFSK